MMRLDKRPVLLVEPWRTGPPSTQAAPDNCVLVLGRPKIPNRSTKCLSQPLQHLTNVYLGGLCSRLSCLLVLAIGKELLKVLPNQGLRAGQVAPRGQGGRQIQVVQLLADKGHQFCSLTVASSTWPRLHHQRPSLTHEGLHTDEKGMRPVGLLMAV